MTFPRLITELPEFEGPFDAYRLAAEDCDVLFASYPAGTVIDDHAHETHNVGVIVSGELVLTVGGQQTRHGPATGTKCRQARRTQPASRCLRPRSSCGSRRDGLHANHSNPRTAATRPPAVASSSVVRRAATSPIRRVATMPAR